MNEFADCLENGSHHAQVKQDVSNAQANGVRATPSFLINGKLVENSQPYSVFGSEIEATLGNG